MGLAEGDEPVRSDGWLSVVGIGEDGVEGLGARAKALIAGAEYVFGGARHIALARGLIVGEASPWPSPFDAAMAAVTALRGRRVCVLASGDPLCHGVGSTLLRQVPASEAIVIPAPSAFSLAAARLGWPLPEVETVSLHGKPERLIRPLLHPGARILALTSDAGGPARVARLLTELGFGPTILTVLEALGGARDRLRGAVAQSFSLADVDPLNILAIEVRAAPDARIVPLTTGIDDSAFETDGQITKREVRAVTLSALAPRRGELLWDVGAGSGSIGIEWMLRHPSLRAIAVERDTARAARIARNAEDLGVAGLRVIHGEAPHALADLPAPDAIFIGGGGKDAAVMEVARQALRPGGRLVANAVTLDFEAVLLGLHAEFGGDMIRLALSRAAPVGAMQGWRPAMPVTQWTWVKP